MPHHPSEPPTSLPERVAGAHRVCATIVHPSVLMKLYNDNRWVDLAGVLQEEADANADAGNQIKADVLEKLAADLIASSRDKLVVNVVRDRYEVKTRWHQANKQRLWWIHDRKYNTSSDKHGDFTSEETADRICADLNEQERKTA